MILTWVGQLIYGVDQLPRMMNVEDAVAQEEEEEREKQRMLLLLGDEKAKKQSPYGGQVKIKERNIVSVRAKKNQPQFIYNRVYISMHPGKCLEYNLSDDTSLLQEINVFRSLWIDRYAVIPQGGRKEEKNEIPSLSQMDWI